MKNNFWLKILEKYYIVVGVIADETDLQILHIKLKYCENVDKCIQILI